MISIRVSIVSFFLISAICLSHAKAPSKYMCGNAECSQIISTARTKHRYSPIEPHMVSFPPNADVRIFRKADADKVWHIEVQGRRGWAPVTALQESKMIVRKEHLVEVFAEVEVVDDVVSVVDVTTKEEAVEVPAIEEKPAEVLAVEEKPAQVPEVEEKPAEVPAVEEKPTVVPTVEEVQLVDDIKPVYEDVDEGYQSDEIAIDTIDIQAEQLPVDTSSPPQNLEELDEDDLLAMEEGKTPVDEPLFIKKEAYKVGEDSLDSNVKLEVVGIDVEEKVAETLTTDSSNVNEVVFTEEPTEPTITEENTQAASNIDEEQVPESDDNIPQEDIVPVQNIDTSTNEVPAVVEPEVEENAPETVSPSATIQHVPSVVSEYTETVASISDIQPSFAAQQTVIDGTTIPDLDTASILTTGDNDNKPSKTESLETATVTPTLNVQPDDSDTTVAEPTSVSEPSAPVVDVKTMLTYETEVDGTFYEYVYTSHSTRTETQASAVDATATVGNSHEELQAGPQAQLSESNEAYNQATEDVQSHAASPTNIVSKTASYEEPKQPEPLKPVIVENSVIDERLEAPQVPLVAPQLPPVVPQVSPVVPQVPSVAPPVPEEAPSHADIHRKPIEIGVGKVEEVVRVEDQPAAINTDDIFSANYVPKTDSEPQILPSDEPVDESSLLESVILGFENVIAPIANIFNFGSSQPTEANSEQVEEKKEELDIDEGFCEKLEGNSCPTATSKQSYQTASASVDLNYNRYIDGFLNKVVEMASLVMCLSIAGACILLFLLGQQCLANHRRESDLISKLNIIERKLLTSDKECGLVKTNLFDTRKKLESIADKSFGADDMIKQCESEKNELRGKVEALEKELEISVEAGLELNKMVTDLLNTQSGSDSIISSVEELQRQLNEQEATTVYINNLLGEKSRENSELQILLSESNNKFGAEIDKLLKENDELRADRETVESELKESIDSLQMQLNKDLEEKSTALEAKSNELIELNKKFEEVVSRWQISMARADAFEDSISKLKEMDSKDDVRTVIEITNANAKLLATEKENESLKEKLDADAYAQSRLNEQITLLNGEIDRLRSEFNQNEKDKLEAQTRLEVLSSYFKDKEAQLQKELSVKEALFMKQQGESTSTVDRVRSLQEEIQGLRSQNDELRAEIEAQSAAHKAQINAAEARAHDSWLAAKQTERRLEEVKSEATLLRKRLTTISFNASGENSLTNQNIAVDALMPLNAPSPIHHIEPSASPPLMGLPLPPFLPPPPFGANAPMPFMPPPPLPLPVDMRGRLISPPPPDDRFGPNDYDNDRDRYRSRYSPEDRFDDFPGVYETETDYSPPRSPEPYRRDRSYRHYSPSPPPQPSAGGRKKSTAGGRKKSSASKGALSSGSTESAASHKRRSGANV